MGIKISKVKTDKLPKTKLPGIFVKLEKDVCYLADKFGNTMYVSDNNTALHTDFEKLNTSFDEHLSNLLYAISHTEDKASVAFLNTNKTYEEINALLDNDYQLVKTKKELPALDTTKSIYIANRCYDQALKNLIEARNEYSPKINNLFVIINNAENIDIKELDIYLTICRSRKIYIVLQIDDLDKFIKKYGESKYNVMEANCLTKYTYQG